MSELKQHPLSAAFPAMSTDDLARLALDIEAHGQREPGVMYEGMILDGWHRYQACMGAGVVFFHEPLPDDVDPVAFVISKNAHRRHLTASQRAAAVVMCSEWAPAGKPAKGEAASPLTNEQMAEAAQTTVRTVQQAKAAVKAGLGEAVRDGDMSAETAAGVASGKAPKPKRSTPVDRQQERAQGAPPAGADDEEAAQAAIEEAQMKADLALIAADDKLAHLMGENKRLLGVVAVLESQIKGAQNREGELIRKVKRLERELAKAAKQA